MGPFLLKTILWAGRTFENGIVPFLILRLMTIFYSVIEPNILYAFLLHLLLPKCHPYSIIIVPFLLFS